MRKASLAVSFALAFVLAAGAMSVVSAQAQRPRTIARAVRPTTTTLTGTVLSNTAAAPWIIFKWGPAKNDILHIRVSNATSFVQNGRLVSRSAVQANMQAQITGYYYGTQINFGTKFNATKVVILAALRPQAVNSARLAGGYHPPAPQSAPPPPAYGRAPAPPLPEFRPALAPAAPGVTPAQPQPARSAYSTAPAYRFPGAATPGAAGTGVGSRPNAALLAAKPQIVNGELVLGKFRIPMKQDAATPGPAALNQKIQAALPGYLRAKFAGGPALMTVARKPASRVSQARMARLTRRPTTRRMMRRATTIMRIQPQAIRRLLAAYKLQSHKVYQGVTSSIGTSGTGYKTVYNAGAALGSTVGEQPFDFGPLNENRQARIQKLLASNQPAPWGTATALPPDVVNPNNWLVDARAVESFAGQLLSSPPCTAPPTTSSPPDSNTTRFSTKNTQPTVSIQPTCPAAPLYVTSPTVSIVIPTHVEGMDSISSDYSDLMPVSQITVQVLYTSNSSPTQDYGDPDGVDFTNNLSSGGVSVISPGQTFSPNVGPEAYSQYLPAWDLDFGAIQSMESSTGPVGSLPACKTPVAGQDRVCSVIGEELVYPNPSATSTNPSDTVTFTLQLTQVVTVIRFLVTTANPYIQPASVVIPIVVQPAGSVQGDVQPIVIAYQPPGDESSVQYSVASSTSATVQASNLYQITSSQGSSNSSAVDLTPSASGSLLGNKLGFSGFLDQGSSTNSQDTQIQSSTFTNSLMQGWTNGFNITTTWPSKNQPLAAPAVTTWRPGINYCASASQDLVEPDPPDGNAYLCEPPGGTSGETQPTFNSGGITQDGSVQWLNVGSAAIFQSPFWNDNFYLQLYPTYAVWGFPGSGPNGIQLAAIPGGGLPWDVTVFQLHLCAEGLYTLADPAANPPLTLPARDCASLLTLDPFYMYGQHLSSNQPSYALAPAPPNNNGIAGAPNSSTQVTNVSAVQASDGQATGTSDTTSISTTTPFSWGVGLMAGIWSGNYTNSSSQTSGSGISSAFLTASTLTSGITSALTDAIQVDTGYYPNSGLWVDSRFGTVMFPSVTAKPTSISPCPDSSGKVIIGGTGLTGTTSVTFGSTPAVFTIASDYEIDAWVPTSMPASSVPVPVTIQGEGFGSTPAGQFTTSCSGN